MKRGDNITNLQNYLKIILDKEEWNILLSMDMIDINHVVEDGVKSLW